VLLESTPNPQVILQLRRSKPTYQYGLGANRIEGSFAEKAAEGLVDNVLNMSEQCLLQLRQPAAYRAALAAARWAASAGA